MDLADIAVTFVCYAFCMTINHNSHQGSQIPAILQTEREYAMRRGL